MWFDIRGLSIAGIFSEQQIILDRSERRKAYDGEEKYTKFVPPVSFPAPILDCMGQI
jgi:hypothetical protein